jgi:hypothetical protein
MLTLGIDPGTKGAVGILIDGEYFNVFDIPTVAKGTGRLEINPSALAQLMKASINYDHDIEVALEKVSAMPGNGSSSMFSFGDSYGCCRSVIACLNLRMMLVSPAAWKKHFKLDREKEISRALAIRLFPTALLHLKKHSDRAEALLMARYLWETRYK